jgi:hypothetical protein
MQSARRASPYARPRRRQGRSMLPPRVPTVYIIPSVLGSQVETIGT